MKFFDKIKNFFGLTKKEYCLCMVLSEQEGAEIWINNKKTTYCTPKLVALPLLEETRLTLKLTGHYDHEAFVHSRHALTYYHCKLQRIPLRIVRDGDALETFSSPQLSNLKNF